MKPTPDNSSLTIPPALLAQLEAAAEQEHRPAAEVVREALESYLARLHGDTVPSPVKRTPAEAAARMLAHRPLRKLPEGESIRSMMEYGRA